MTLKTLNGYADEIVIHWLDNSVFTKFVAKNYYYVDIHTLVLQDTSETVIIERKDIKLVSCYTK